jgi:hypothetical protein
MVGLPGVTLFSVNPEYPYYASCILANNVSGTPGGGYTEIWRSPGYWDNINDMMYQPQFGTTMGGIWVACADEIVWVPFSPDRPSTKSSSRYFPDGMITSGYCYASLYDIYKIYKSIKVFAEGLVEDQQFIELEYQTDSETTWHKIDEQVNESVKEIDITDPPGGVTAKRFRWRMKLHTTDSTKSPEVKALVIDAISRVPIKYSYALPYRTKDGDVDLLGNKESLSSEEKQAILDAWAQNLTPLRMYSIRRQYHDQAVFIDGMPTNPSGEKTEEYTSRLTMVQL